MEMLRTMAGHTALAGAARLRVEAVAHAGYGHALATHPAPHAPQAIHASVPASRMTSWTEGAAATKATFVVLDRKNCPTRLLPERST